MSYGDELYKSIILTHIINGNLEKLEKHYDLNHIKFHDILIYIGIDEIVKCCYETSNEVIKFLIKLDAVWKFLGHEKFFTMLIDKNDTENIYLYNNKYDYSIDDNEVRKLIEHGNLEILKYFHSRDHMKLDLDNIVYALDKGQMIIADYLIERYPIQIHQIFQTIIVPPKYIDLVIYMICKYRDDKNTFFQYKLIFNNRYKIYDYLSIELDKIKS